MDIVSTRNFGLLIAYVIPGFICLLGIACVSEPVWVWLVGAGMAGPSVGGVLFVGVASVGAGMTASVIRWAILDTLHRSTGLRRPELDESNLADRLAAIDYLVEQHYRYYQFYGNSFVAAVAAHLMWRWSGVSDGVPAGPPELLLVILGGVFIAGSRDALRNYYAGSIMLLGTLVKENDHDQRQAPSDAHQDHPREGHGADPGSGGEHAGRSGPGGEDPAGDEPAGQGLSTIGRRGAETVRGVVPEHAVTPRAPCRVGSDPMGSVRTGHGTPPGDAGWRSRH